MGWQSHRGQNGLYDLATMRPNFANCKPILRFLRLSITESNITSLTALLMISLERQPLQYGRAAANFPVV
jgi:hypothetical protein